jgi:rubrerythrin
VSHLPKLDVLDKDGAIREHAEKVDGNTRRSFLTKAAVGGVTGGLVFGGLQLGANAQSTTAASDSLSDLEILNFALVLEYLEATFYTEAVQKAGLSGELATYARTLRDHENAHVQALTQAIQQAGSTPVSKPSFDFGESVTNRSKFIQTSVTLEMTGVGAYQGAAPSLANAEYLKAAASILAVEAFHTAWGRTLTQGGELPAPAAFNEALTVQQVLQRVGSTGFITSQLPAAITQAASGTPSTVG